jgi:two-component system sensor histidine kinase PilS (NtrC family)
VNRAAAYGTVSRWLLHDFRNPTQALTLVLELLQEPSSADRELIHTIQASTAHLTRSLELMDRVLRTAPPGAEAGLVNVLDSLEFVGSLLRVHKSSVGIDTTEALTASLPLVRGVREHLDHTLLNLLLNAVEAIGPQEGTIRIRAAARGTSVELTVSDDGPGVAPEVRARLFEPFVTTKRRGPLAGLGLVVARELIGRAGGTVDHLPGSDGGACFRLTLRT